MSNRLSIFYTPCLYLAILLFLLGEGTVALDFARSIIPGYSHSVVTTLIMIGVIFLGFIKGINRKTINMMFSSRLIFAGLPIIFFVLASYIDIIVNLFSSNVSFSYAAFLIRHLLFIFLVLQAIACGEPFIRITKPYFHLMLFILITGATLFLLNIVIDNINNYSVDVGFLRKSGEGNLGRSLYSMPFGMGLLITGQNLANFLGFNFYQFSSYFFEPQIFGFMMVPGFIIFLQKNYRPDFGLKTPMILVAMVLIIWAHSLTTLSALLGIGFVWLFLRNIYSAIFILTIFTILLLVVIANLDELSLTISLLNKLNSSSSESSINLFTEIWQNLSFMGDGAFNIRVGEKGRYLSAFSLLLWGSFVIALFFNIVIEILINKNSAFAYALLFLFICYFKDLWHLPMSPISIYLCLIFFAYKFNQEHIHNAYQRLEYSKI